MISRIQRMELENKKLDVKILPGVEIDSVDDYIDFHIFESLYFKP